MYRPASPALSTTSQSDNEDDDYNPQGLTAIIPAQWSSRRHPPRALNTHPTSSLASRLPPEILIHVLKHLHSSRDLYHALLVSRAWCECSVELLWYRPSFARFSTLVKMMRILSRADHMFTYAHFIRRLNFICIGSDLTDSLFGRLAQCIRLERLTLINCSAVSDDGLMRVLPNCPNLVALDLTGVSDVSDRTIVALAANTKRLQGINLTGCKELTDKTVLALAANCHLLRRVKLSKVDQITDTSISALAHSCPLLLEIDLNNCKRITDVSVRDLWTYSTQMREMRLSHCIELTDAAFPAPRRDVLLPGPNPFASSSVHALPADPLPPLRLPHNFEHLRLLDLTACSAITDEAVEGIISVAPKIRNFVLAKCSQLTDVAVDNICKLGKHLHYLHLGHAGSVTDRSINNLVRSCTRLRYIDLANCLQLTDMSVFELSSLQKLRRIGLVRVANLTDQAIQALGERQATLERIHLSYCEQISVMSIHYLLQKLPKLTHLSLTGIPAFRRPELQQFCRPPPQDFNTSQRAAFCVYSGKGVAELREFLADLFKTITAELATANDTDYDEEHEEEYVHYAGAEEDAMDEDEDDEQADSETFATGVQNPPIRTPYREVERIHVPEEEVIPRTVRVPPVARELMMTRDSGRHPSSRTHPHSTPAWLHGQLSPRRGRGFAHQPIVELSTSPTPSDVASIRSVGTNQSSGTAFFRSYAEANGAGRHGGTLTPDLVYAEIGHGRGAGPGPSTILVQNHTRREHAVDSTYNPTTSTPPRQTIGLPPASTYSISTTDVLGTPRAFRMQEHDLRMDYAPDRSPVLMDTSNSYQRVFTPHADGQSGFAVVRESTPPPPSPTTRELHDSVHSALAGSESRGRSVKRTLRNTFAAAETFFSGRTSGGSAHDTTVVIPRDGDTHGH